MRARTAAGLVAAAAFIGQVQGVLGAAWIWDDAPMLAHQDLYTNPARLHESLTTPLGFETHYWRPLGTLSFLAGAWAHGLEPAAFRATSAVFHAITAGVLVMLLARFLRSPGAALLAGLAWALHPVHVEAVTWISARFDVLAGLFAVLALWAAGDGAERGVLRKVALAASVTGACLSKESGFVLPAVVPLWAAAIADPVSGAAGRTLLGRWKACVLAAAGFGVYWFLRYEAGVAIGLNRTSVASAGRPLEHALLVGHAFLVYAEALVLPWLGAGPTHYVTRPIPADDLRAWSGLLLLAGAIGGTLLALRRRPRTGFLAAAFLVSLAPVLQILPLDLSGGFVAADRFVYLPSLFFVALAADLLTALAARTGARTGVVAAACILLASYVGMRVVILPRWSSSERYWGWAAERSPGSTAVRAANAGALLEAGKLAEAEVEARAGATEVPWQHAEVLARLGRTDEALQVLDTAVVARSQDTPTVLLLRAKLRLVAGKFADALDDADRVLDAVPVPEPSRPSTRTRATAMKAHAMARLGDSRARDVLLDAERMAQADQAHAWIDIAAAWASMSDADRCVAAADRALAARADPVEAHGIAANALAMASRSAEAAARYRKVLELRPGDPEVLDHLGYALFDAGQREESERMLREALSANPGFVRARYHLAVLLSKTDRIGEARVEAGRALEDVAGMDDAVFKEMVEALVKRLQ